MTGGVVIGMSERTSFPSPARNSTATAARGVDHDLVRELREQVARRLAPQLQASPALDAGTRRELCRSLLAEALATRAREPRRAGLAAWDVETEFALAEAVMAAVFGLGRLQPLVDDPGIENIEVNGCDQVWLSYADGRTVPGPAVATPTPS